MPTSTRTNAELAVFKSATIRDVARVAGVTTATVSRTLSGKRQGTAAVREAVFRAVEELNYQPNPNAQRLATGRTEKQIDLLSLNLDFGMDARKAQLIQNLLRTRGFNAPLHAYGWGGRGADEQRELVCALRRERPRAIVCDLSGLSAPALAELQRFQAEGGHVVGFGYGRGAARPWCDQVLFDPEHSMELAVQHFAELGHRHVGTCFPTHSGDANRRGARFQELAARFQLETRDDWIYQGAAREASIEYEDTGEQIARWFLNLPASERPTALFVSNDYAALRLLNELHHAGVRVPHDLSLVGHDDRPLARSAWVPLSSITHPADQIARHVVALLLERLDGTDLPARTLIVQGQLQIRQSSAPPALR